MNNARARSKLAVLLVSAGLVLSACGFHLRGDGGTSFRHGILVDGPGTQGNAIANAFGTALTDAGGRVASNLATANAVLYLHRAQYLRQSITLSRTGRSTGFDLIYRISYEIRDPQGKVLQPRKELESKREYFNDQTLPLAQLSEEAQIREELEKETAQILLRRVALALKRGAKPDQPPL